jgi:hypothetical protein
LKHPQTHELPLRPANSEPHPHAQPVHADAALHPLGVGGHDLVTGSCPWIEVTQHQRVGIKLHFQVDVLIRERNKLKPIGTQGCLGHELS